MPYDAMDVDQNCIFPVGRPDEDTLGIILVTSNGRLPNASLQGKYKHDVIYLDWQIIKDKNPTTIPPVFDYIKYWKPIGVTCTTDRRIENNLINALR